MNHQEYRQLGCKADLRNQLNLNKRYKETPEKPHFKWKHPIFYLLLFYIICNRVWTYITTISIFEKSTKNLYPSGFRGGKSRGTVFFWIEAHVTLTGPQVKIGGLRLILESYLYRTKISLRPPIFTRGSVRVKSASIEKNWKFLYHVIPHPGYP